MEESVALRSYFQAHKQEMIDTLAAWVAVPSVRGDARPGMPYGAEPARMLKLALEQCAALGFQTESVADCMGSVELNDLPAALAVLCHLDVVPAGEGWSQDPFVLTHRQDTDRLYGRGAIDNKGPAVAALYAMRAIRELHIPMKHGVRLLLGTDEENGSSDLTAYLQQRTMPPMVFTPDGDYPVINIEKGMLRLTLTAGIELVESGCRVEAMEGGTVVNGVPACASARIRDCSRQQLESLCKQLPEGIRADLSETDGCCDVTLQGLSAHASKPELGKNALTALLALLVQLPLPDEQHALLNVLHAAYPYGDTDGSALGIGCRDEKSGALTHVLSLLTYQKGRLTAWVDLRYPLCGDGEAIIARITEVLQSGGISTQLQMHHKPHETPESSPFVRTLLDVYAKSTGQPAHALAIGGGTYVHDIPGGVAFGAEFPGEENQMHGGDESIRVDSFLKIAELTALAMIRLCGDASEEML